MNLVRMPLMPGPQQTVKISTYTQNGDIVLEVKDPGCGMPAEVMSKLGTPSLLPKSMVPAWTFGLLQYC